MAIHDTYKGLFLRLIKYIVPLCIIIRAEMPLAFLRCGQRLSYSRYIGCPNFQGMQEQF